MPDADVDGILGAPPESETTCPKCSETLYREEVDVGVGIITGPYGCSACGYSEAPEYDRTSGTNDATQGGAADRWCDQWGVSHSRERLRERLDRFGLGHKADEVFEKKTSS